MNWLHGMFFLIVEISTLVVAILSLVTMAKYVNSLPVASKRLLIVGFVSLAIMSILTIFSHLLVHDGRHGLPVLRYVFYSSVLLNYPAYGGILMGLYCLLRRGREGHWVRHRGRTAVTNYGEGR